MLGLNDAHIGHTSTADLGKGRAGHEKGDGKYVLSRSPDYILMGNVAVLPYPVDKERMAKKLVRKSEHELWAEPRFHDTYELVCFQLSNTDMALTSPLKKFGYSLRLCASHLFFDSVFD